MTQKIGVIIIHGAGTPTEDFAEALIARISKRFANEMSNEQAAQELVFEPVFWSAIFEQEQLDLWDRVQQGDNLNYHLLRKFVVDFLGDAVAYQPTALGNQNYDKVHSLVAAAINRLRTKVGPHAPLCVISHSLGTVIASNYFYDLQYKRENIGLKTKAKCGDTPLEQCQTLTLFYTLGSPIALWALRYMDFGTPVTLPSKSIRKRYPSLTGEWLNFYDKDDILAYPLKGINAGYQLAVTKDVEVNVGGLLTSWNPLSHNQYEAHKDVVYPIVNGLIRIWNEINVNHGTLQSSHPSGD
jgi:hypothetical protein